MTPLPSVRLKILNGFLLELLDGFLESAQRSWNCLWRGPCFPCTEPGLCTNTGGMFLSTHTPKGQLEDREEQLPECDEKAYWIGITDYTFTSDNANVSTAALKSVFFSTSIEPHTFKALKALIQGIGFFTSSLTAWADFIPTSALNFDKEGRFAFGALVETSPLPAPGC